MEVGRLSPFGLGIFVKTRDVFHTNTIWKAGTEIIVMHIKDLI